MSYQI